MKAELIKYSMGALAAGGRSSMRKRSAAGVLRC
jgi:hypothetical protein